jgi:hypothetical protein
MLIVSVQPLRYEVLGTLIQVVVFNRKLLSIRPVAAGNCPSLIINSSKLS